MEYFKCNYFNVDDIVILSTYNEPLCNISDPKTIIAKPEIYAGNTKTNLITSVKTKDSTVAEKFSAEFINKLTEKQETFDINCDIKFRICGIFHGKEKKGAPMVCKIERNIYYANNYKVTIAAGVDVAFVIALSFIFIKRSFKENSKKQPAVIKKNYLTEIAYRTVESPIKPISIVDEKYVTQKPLLYKIEKEKKILSDYNYRIKDIDDTEIYLSKEKLRGSVIYNKNNEPIIGITDSYDSVIQRKINLGKKDDMCIGSIKLVNSNVLNKFILEFLNKDTGIYESFMMNCDPDYFIGIIFYDNGQGNTYLVAKILKDQYNKYQYTVEIAPGVDNIYIIATCIHFIENSLAYYSSLGDGN